MDKLYRVQLRKLCFGVTVNNDNKIVRIAPVFKFAKGWDLTELQKYIWEKGGIIKEVKDNE